MPVEYYLCPYDTVPRGRQQPFRRCAMCRHVPRVPNAQGADWDEAETLGNSCLVKLDAPAAIHATVQADADFQRVPSADGVVPHAARPVILGRLVALGFTPGQVAATGWRTEDLFDLLTAQVHEVEADGRGGVRVTARRRPGPKRRQDLDRRLPG